MARPLVLLFAALLTTLSPSLASAQSMDERAETLRSRAKSAYFEMEMESALAYVDQALSLCVMGCSDPQRASLMVMKGMIVYVARNDADEARRHFREALDLDPGAKTDPMLSNPSVEKLFAQTRARAFDPYAATAEDEPPEETPVASPAESLPVRSFNRIFLEVGYSVGLATAHEGMRAATTPVVASPGDDPQLDSIPENDSFVLSGTHGCGAPAGGYCVRKTEGLATLAHGLNLGAGYHVSEKFALAVRVRWNPNAGEGLMSNILVGLRGHMRLTEQRLRGFHASLFAGLMIGQIQVQPDQAPAVPGGEIQKPWARTGLGGIEMGAKIGYRFAPLFGVYISPEIYALVPDFSAGAVVTSGLELAFGRSDSLQHESDAPPSPEPLPDTERAPADVDADGVPDHLDACPAEAEDVDGYEDEDGCPDLDRDGDGVPDAVDRCPTEPEDADGFQDEDGCPEDAVESEERACVECAGPDRDSDGVADHLDNCPDEAGAPEHAGCTTPQLVRLTAGGIELLGSIEFKTNRDVIERRSLPLLEDLARVINAHPEITTVRIEAHTDSTGSAKRNLKLSRKRAIAVRRHLVVHGKVSARRLSAHGYGPERPLVADATTKEEHARNRRVEIVTAID